MLIEKIRFFAGTSITRTKLAEPKTWLRSSHVLAEAITRSTYRSLLASAGCQAIEDFGNQIALALKMSYHWQDVHLILFSKDIEWTTKFLRNVQSRCGPSIHEADESGRLCIPMIWCDLPA
jgi:hypothetical protein